MTETIPLPYSAKKGLKRPFSNVEERTIALAYQDEEQWTHDTLGKAVGVSGGTIRAILKRQNISSRPVGVRGPRHGSWNGGKVINTFGYEMTWIPDNHFYASMKGAKGRVLTHRLVMAEYLLRPLRRDETVHHIDGDKLNNDIENLQLRSGSHGTGVAMKCVECGSTNVQPIALEDGYTGG